MDFSCIPKELLDMIAEYDGRIKYKRGKYETIIPKNDKRYDIIKPLIIKKIEILKTLETSDKGGFYFQFGFDVGENIGLCYDYNFTYKDTFEICYYDFREKFIQIRTYL